MSSAKITLRPPPNVEFVQGYPGISPAAPDRPQAAVKGTIELRLGAQGVKAKWVRIELRKVETLPGGGQANTFYDFVGQSPVNIWQAQEEWSLLHTQDFPFFIRIPESIPPSIALEKNAGIKYELIATVCTKGKKGILRRASSPTLSTLAHIIIDKHELHSTWPIYAQPESRHVVTDALTLTIDRTHTCYGPGDRVAVLATLKNDNLSTVVLRAFAFMLKETIIFRAGPHVPGKKGAPQVRVSTIGEQKVPVNATLFGGTLHKAELACFIPQTHTTTTVTAARHIDIAYSINVEAVLASGKPLLIELPVTVSNWPRPVSIEAVRRIGPSPNLSLIPPGHVQTNGLPQHVQRPGSAGQGSSQGHQSPFPNSRNQAPNHQAISGRGPIQSRPYSTAGQSGWGGGDFVSTQHGEVRNGYLTGGATSAGRSGVDEFGYSQTNGAMPQPATFAGYPGAQASLMSSTNHHVNESPGMSSVPSGSASVDTSGRRGRSITGGSAANRFTVVNMTGDAEEEDEPLKHPSPVQQHYPNAMEEKRNLQNYVSDAEGRAGGSSSSPPKPAHPPSSTSPVRTPWPTAEEEKQRLFNKAKADAERIQADMGTSGSSQIPQSQSDVPQKVVGRSSSSRAVSPPKPTPWATAEAEKMRLFDQAQAMARATQAHAANPSPLISAQSGQGNAAGSLESASGPSSNHIVKANIADSIPTISPGAKLYSNAMSSLARNGAAQGTPEPPKSQSQRSPPANRSKFPTAEEEKAAMRYYEAKRAVDRVQNVDIGSSELMSPVPAEEPISYDVLYPSGPSGAQQQAGPSHSPNEPLTPPLRLASPQLTEPRQAYYNEGAITSEDQSQSMSANHVTSSILPPSGSPPPAIIPSLQHDDVLSEKERLRRRYEVQDAAASAHPGISPPKPPPRSETLPSSTTLPTYGASPTRSQPLPPTSNVGGRPLTALEEKARLRAQYEAEENGGSVGASAGRSSKESFHGYPAITRSTSMARSQSTNSLSRDPSLSFINMKNDPATEEFLPPPQPPPLLPRPPAEYIQETQEEDARTQAEEHTLLKSPTEAQSSWEHSTPPANFDLNFRPFSPIDLSLGFDATGDGGYIKPAPPPLPPKVPVSE